MTHTWKAEIQLFDADDPGATVSSRRPTPS